MDEKDKKIRNLYIALLVVYLAFIALSSGWFNFLFRDRGNEEARGRTTHLALPIEAL